MSLPRTPLRIAVLPGIVLSISETVKFNFKREILNAQKQKPMSLP
jgi:hypothetical protein